VIAFAVSVSTAVILFIPIVAIAAAILSFVKADVRIDFIVSAVSALLVELIVDIELVDVSEFELLVELEFELLLDELELPDDLYFCLISSEQFILVRFSG
jgi:hypothetical protein